MKLYEKARAVNVARLIFQLWQDNKRTDSQLKSNWFHAQLKERYPHLSPITLLKAKKALRIKSVKIAGSFRWTFPHLKYATQEKRQIALQEALTRLNPRGRQSSIYKVQNKQEKLEKYLPYYINVLRELFQANHYEVPASQVKEMFVNQSQGIWNTTKYIYPAKKALEVHTYIEDRRRIWVWTDNTVQDWLEAHTQRPILRDKLEQQARAIGWTDRVLSDSFRRSEGLIRAYRGKKSGRWYWVCTVSNLVPGDSTADTGQPQRIDPRAL
jgi:hypothetical protein